MSDPMKVCVEIEVQEIADAIIRKLTEDETLVEVVRCKKCLRYYEGRNGWTCGLTGCTHNGEWYCADAERKTE